MSENINESLANLDYEVAITTVDNPYDPFDQFENWILFDNLKGYSTCSYLSRIAKTSSQLSPAENNREIERAIDEIIAIDPFGIYKKIKRKIGGTNAKEASK